MRSEPPPVISDSTRVVRVPARARPWQESSTIGEEASRPPDEGCLRRSGNRSGALGGCSRRTSATTAEEVGAATPPRVGAGQAADFPAADPARDSTSRSRGLETWSTAGPKRRLLPAAAGMTRKSHWPPVIARP